MVIPASNKTFAYYGDTWAGNWEGCGVVGNEAEALAIPTFSCDIPTLQFTPSSFKYFTYR
jgi:hypothetical protein